MVDQLTVQIQEPQEQVNSFNDARDLGDFETASSSGSCHVPKQTLSCSEFLRKASLRLKPSA